MKTIVIVNPRAGRRRKTQQKLHALRQTLPEQTIWVETENHNHAECLAESAMKDGFEHIIAAGGDGTVHQVSNGMLKSPANAVTLGVVPLGSANDYFASFPKTKNIGRTTDFLVDVGLVTTPKKQRYFLCCCGIGFNAAVTAQSERIQTLRGLPLYFLAALKALVYDFRLHDLSIEIDDHSLSSQRFLMVSALIGRREGNFPMGPKAIIDDGKLDYVLGGPLSRWEIIKILPRLAVFGPPQNHKKVTLGLCQDLKIHCELPIPVHLDGELLGSAEEPIHDIHISILPRHLCVNLYVS